ncbi:MAG TPA: hypothetical protein VF157_14725, partial [Chloroflexota bacterium]
SGKLVSQDDHPPLTPTTAWQPRDAFTDVFVVPQNPAMASLEIGAYDASGKRTNFNVQGGSASDHLAVPSTCRYKSG